MPELSGRTADCAVKGKRLGIPLEAPELDLLLIEGQRELPDGFGTDFQNAGAEDFKAAHKEQVIIRGKDLHPHSVIKLRRLDLIVLGLKRFRFRRLGGKGLRVPIASE